jgi:hypothetical protein
MIGWMDFFLVSSMFARAARTHVHTRACTFVLPSAEFNASSLKTCRYATDRKVFGGGRRLRSLL